MNQPSGWHFARVIDSPIIDYGRGRTKRRTSRAAVLSLILSLALLSGACAVCWSYYSPSLRLGGLGSGLLVIGLFLLLVQVAAILVPICLVLGVSALISIRRHPDRLRGRVPAILGMLLSVLVGTAVAYGGYEARKRIAASQVMLTNSIEYRTYNQSTDLWRLLEDCRIYASRHDGAYPPDLIALSGTVPHDASVDRDFVYCGQGLIDEPSIERPVNNSIIVLISASPTADGVWIVGVKGSPRTARTLYVRQSELPTVVRRSNELRQSAGLPPIDFAKLLNRPELANAPTTPSAAGTK